MLKNEREDECEDISENDYAFVLSLWDFISLILAFYDDDLAGANEKGDFYNRYCLSFRILKVIFPICIIQ